MTVLHAEMRLLPGVLDRAALQPALEAAAQASRALGHSLAVLTVDIDHFRNYQDAHGMERAGQVLTQLALLLEQLKPSTARLAYLGGDEFVLVLPDTDLGAAVALAERLRERVAEALTLLEHQPPLSASLGVAASPAGRDWSARCLLTLADARMSFAKRRLPPHHNQVFAGALPSDWMLRLDIEPGAWPNL